MALMETGEGNKAPGPAHNCSRPWEYEMNKMWLVPSLRLYSHKGMPGRLVILCLTLQNHFMLFSSLPGKTDHYKMGLLGSLTLWLLVGFGQQKTLSREDGEKEKPGMAHPCLVDLIPLPLLQLLSRSPSHSFVPVTAPSSCPFGSRVSTCLALLRIPGHSIIPQ